MGRIVLLPMASNVGTQVGAPPCLSKCIPLTRSERHTALYFEWAPTRTLVGAHTNARGQLAWSAISHGLLRALTRAYTGSHGLPRARTGGVMLAATAPHGGMSRGLHGFFTGPHGLSCPPPAGSLLRDCGSHGLPRSPTVSHAGSHGLLWTPTRAPTRVSTAPTAPTDSHRLPRLMCTRNVATCSAYSQTRIPRQSEMLRPNIFTPISTGTTREQTNKQTNRNNHVFR